MTITIGTKSLVVGAGISGLSIAARVPDSLVISKNVGGLIGSVKQDGFTFDYGGHVYTTFHAKTTRILELANAQLHMMREAFFDVSRRIPFPVQDYADRLGVPLLKQRPTSFARNLDEYSRALFGDPFVDAFYAPFNERVWCTPISNLDVDWVDGRVKRPDEAAAGWGMNSSFYYAPGTQIVDVLARDALANGATFMTGTVVVIRPSLKTVTVDIGHNEHVDISYQNLFCATPYFLPELQRNSIVTVGVGLKSTYQDEPFHWVYPRFGQDVHRVTLLSRYYEGMAPDGCDSLLLEIPFSPTKPVTYVTASLMACNPELRKYWAATMLSMAGFSVREDDIATVWAEVTPGYPIQTVGVRQLVTKVKYELFPYGVYLAGRWGAHGYFNMQHIIDDADAVVAAANAPSGPGLPDEWEDYAASSFYYTKAR